MATNATAVMEARLGGRVPRYLQIAEALRRRLTGGVPGRPARLPSEPTLASEFRVSRETLREALALLRDEGLIYSRVGLGTFASPGHRAVGVRITQPINEPYVGGRFAMGGFELDPGGAKFVEFEPGRKATLRFADGFTSSWELDGSDGKTRLTLVQSGFEPTNPPYPGWAGWLGGIAALRRYHELPNSRSIWRQIEFPGVPAGMLAIDQ